MEKRLLRTKPLKYPITGRRGFHLRRVDPMVRKRNPEPALPKNLDKDACLVRIRGILPSLKTAERKVGAYILEHAEEVIHSTVSEISTGSGASEATVIRFCRTLRYKGFQDLKISLARDLVSPLHRIHEELDEGDDTKGIVRKVFASNVQALYDTMDVLDPESVARAAKALAEAQRILLIGVGTSAPNVQDAYNKFMRLGLDCIVETDSHLQVMSASLCSPADAVLAISHSGSTMDPIETLKVARGSGATTICITNNAISPITRVADIVLVTAARETKYRSEAIASRIAQSTIVDVLFTIVAMETPERYLTSMRKIEDAIVIKQY